MATTTYQHTEPLTETAAAHVEAARQRAHAACLQQAYASLRTTGTYTITAGETVTPAGRKPGSIQRTLTVTS